MKIFITKFALTKGIVVAEAEIIQTTGTAVVKGAIPWQDFRFSKDQWTTDPQRAVAAAERMRDQQAANLQRKIDALKAKTFTPPELI